MMLVTVLTNGSVQLKCVNWKDQVTVRPQYRSGIIDCFTFPCGLENIEKQTERVFQK